MQMGLVQIWIDRDRLTLAGNRSLALAIAQQGDAEVREGFGIVWLEEQSLPVSDDNLVEGSRQTG
jgi:hypothetical protein